MNELEWSVESITLPLRYLWKISRNATTEKTNFIVTVRQGERSGRGEAAPNVRYGETPELLAGQFRRFTETAPDDFSSAEELQSHCDAVETSFALRFAIESAWLHLKSGGRRSTFQQRLGVPFRENAPTSYTIPIMDPGELRGFHQRENLSRFSQIKLKVNRESAFELVRVLTDFTGQTVLLDANESFTDVEECIRFLEKVRKLNIELVEQPLPSALTEESAYLKKYCPFPLFADEAITHDPDFDTLVKCFDGINMKLMKAGGYMQGLNILREARKRGMRTMIGCMVETSLGISSALNLAGLADYIDLDSFILLQHEPFGLLKEENGVLLYRENEQLC